MLALVFNAVEAYCGPLSVVSKTKLKSRNVVLIQAILKLFFKYEPRCKR